MKEVAVLSILFTWFIINPIFAQEDKITDPPPLSPEERLKEALEEDEEDNDDLFTTPRRYNYDLPTKKGDERPEADDFYPIGWSDDGSFAWATVKADVDCDCFFFGMFIYNLEKDSLLWKYTYNNANQIHEEDTSAIYSSIYGLWGKEKNLFSYTLKNFHIEPTYYKSYSIYSDGKKDNYNCRIEKVDSINEKDYAISYTSNMAQFDFSVSGKKYQNFSKPVFTGYLESPNKTQQKVVILLMNWKYDERKIQSLKLKFLKNTGESNCELTLLKHPPFKEKHTGRATGSFESITIKEEHDLYNILKSDQNKNLSFKDYSKRNHLKPFYSASKPLFISERIENGSFHLSGLFESDSIFMAVYGKQRNQFDDVLYPTVVSFYSKIDSICIGSFDFSNYQKPSNETVHPFLEQHISWLEYDRGVVYVQTNNHMDAKMSEYKNGYISAIELSTGNLLWQSPALIANTQNFILTNSHIISAYSHQEETNKLYILDRKSGEVLNERTLESAVNWLILSKDEKKITYVLYGK